MAHKALVANPERFTVTDFFHIFIYPSDYSVGHLWFLPTIFSIMVAAVLLLKWTRREWIICVPMAISLLSPLWGWDLYAGVEAHTTLYEYVVRYFVWWGAGFYFYKFQGPIVRALRLHSGWVCLGLLTVLLSDFWHPWHFAVRIVAGLLFCVSFGLFYVKRGLHFLDFLFGYSYSIYLFHWFVLIFMRGIFANFDIDEHIEMPISFVLGIGVPYLVARFAKTHLPNARFLRILVGI